jgi:threonine dehydrogenase-like Zn-dependent dehydrogenase
MRRLSLIGPASKTEASLRAAVGAINDGSVDLGGVSTQAFRLDQVAEGIAQLGHLAIDGPIHLGVEP